jgi:hypothetical protein
VETLRDGDGGADLVQEDGLRFYLVEDESPAGGSKLAAARAVLREVLQAEWEERQRLARAKPDGLTPAHLALLQARQAQVQRAQATVDDLLRRAASLRHAIAEVEESFAVQRRLLGRLQRELAEIGE